MAIRFPRLGLSACKNLTFCADIKSAEKGFLHELRTKRYMVATFQIASHVMYVRAMTSGGAAKHLHVDYASADFFNNGKTPKVTHKKADVEKLLMMAIGATVDALVQGTFIVGINRLPVQGLIAQLSSKQGGPELAIRMTAGTFEISGAPIAQIRWAIREKQKQMWVEIAANRSLRITDTVLPEQANWLNTQLERFVLGK